MIGINPTPELRNYSHIIIANIKAIIIKHNSKSKTQVNSHENVTVSYFRVETPLYRVENTPQQLTNENLKPLL